MKHDLDMEFAPSRDVPSAADVLDAVRKADGDTFDTAIQRAIIRPGSRSWLARALGFRK